MKTIRVGFSYRKNNLFSSIIKEVTASKVSHVYIRVPNKLGDDLIFQASGLQVNLCSLSVFLEKEVVLEEYDIEVSGKQYTYFRKFIVSSLGKPYGLAEIFGFLFIIIAKKFGKTINNPFSQGDKAYICVQLAMDCIGLTDNDDKWNPEEFRRWCEKNAKVVLP